MSKSLEANPSAARVDGAGGESAPRRWWEALAVGLVALGTIAMWAWSDGDQRRALERMPEAERRAGYLRTLESQQQICAAPRQGLQAYCQAQADFLAEFPECDSACSALVAAQHLPRPR